MTTIFDAVFKKAQIDNRSDQHVRCTSDAQGSLPMIFASGAYSRCDNRYPGSSGASTGRERFLSCFSSSSAFFLDDLRRLRAATHFVIPLAVGEHNIVIHEIMHAPAQRVDLAGKFEVHPASLLWLTWQPATLHSTFTAVDARRAQVATVDSDVQRECRCPACSGKLQCRR